jgi:hypothetical protein
MSNNGISTSPAIWIAVMVRNVYLPFLTVRPL